MISFVSCCFFLLSLGAKNWKEESSRVLSSSVVCCECALLHRRVVPSGKAENELHAWAKQHKYSPYYSDILAKKVNGDRVEVFEEEIVKRCGGNSGGKAAPESAFLAEFARLFSAPNPPGEARTHLAGGFTYEYLPWQPTWCAVASSSSSTSKLHKFENRRRPPFPI